MRADFSFFLHRAKDKLPLSSPVLPLPSYVHLVVGPLKPSEGAWGAL